MKTFQLKKSKSGLFNEKSIPFPLIALFRTKTRLDSEFTILTSGVKKLLFHEDIYYESITMNIRIFSQNTVKITKTGKSVSSAPSSTFSNIDTDVATFRTK